MTYRDAVLETLGEFHDSERGKGPADQSERAWLAFCDKVEKAFGGDIDLDGSEGIGVCLDGAYTAFERGATVAQYLATPKAFL